MPPFLRIKTREEWGAQPAVFQEPKLQAPVTKLFYWYHTPVYHWRTNNSNECVRIMREMQRRHVEDLGFSDVAYHYIVATDGFVYEGRELSVNTPKSLTFNPVFYGNRIDIAFMGDYLFSDPIQKFLDIGFQVANLCVKLRKLHKMFSYRIIREALVLPAEKEEIMKDRYFCREVTYTSKKRKKRKIHSKGDSVKENNDEQ